MIEFPSGNKYKLVYFDTNFLSEFINNQYNFTSNVSKQFFGGKEKYLICTSFFNIFELYKTNDEFEEKMKLAFDKIPIGIVKDYSSLIELEHSNQITTENIIQMAFGIKPIFNLDIHDLFEILRNCTSEINDRSKLIANEIDIWNTHRLLKDKEGNPKKQILKSMNELLESIFNNLRVDKNSIEKYKSLECMAYIKDEFIFNTKIDIKQNSIIDMYNISILPYIDAYATENFVGKKIENEMKQKFKYIKAKVFFIRDFKENPALSKI